MNRITMGLLVVTGCGVALASDDIPPPRPVDVAAIVRQLGSDEFAEREAATRRLSTLSVDEVPPELLAALKSPNPEVRDRAGRAVKRLREHIALGPERAAINSLPRGERFAKRGQIDLYVASTAASDYKEDDPRLWEPALDVGRIAINKAEMAGERMPGGCPALFPSVVAYKKGYNAWFARLDEPYTKQWRGAGGILAPGFRNRLSFCYHIAVSRGAVHTPGSQYSLILATGDFDSEDNISGSVVICDGDVRVGGNVFKSLIIAHGGISIKGTAASSTFIAGKTVTIDKPSGLRRRLADDPRDQEMFDKDWQYLRVITEEHAVKPLGYITFFELSTVGVEAKAADKTVRVTAVADGKAFAAAGVKVGDIVIDVNGKKPDSPESLRRHLRDALALGDATVKLQRGDKTATVKVALPE